jgi:polar amino acid transport system substrate-binding protein
MYLNHSRATAFLLALVAGAAHPGEVLSVCAAPFPPYSYLRNGKPAGIDIEVAKTLFGQLNVPFSVKIEPFARCQEALKSGAADVGLAVSNKQDRKAYLYFPKNAVWKTNFVFFTNQKTKRKYDIRSIEDAKRNHLKIGIVRGAIYHESFWDAFPGQDPAINEGYNPALVPAPDTATNFRQLQLNHIQLYPQDRIAGLWEARAEHTVPCYYETVLFSNTTCMPFQSLPTTVVRAIQTSSC